MGVCYLERRWEQRQAPCARADHRPQGIPSRRSANVNPIMTRESAGRQAGQRILDDRQLFLIPFLAFQVYHLFDFDCDDKHTICIDSDYKFVMIHQGPASVSFSDP